MDELESGAITDKAQKISNLIDFISLFLYFLFLND